MVEKRGRKKGAKNKPKFVNIPFNDLDNYFKGNLNIPVEKEWALRVLGSAFVNTLVFTEELAYDTEEDEDNDSTTEDEEIIPLARVEFNNENN